MSYSFWTNRVFLVPLVFLALGYFGISGRNLQDGLTYSLPPSRILCLDDVKRQRNDRTQEKIHINFSTEKGKGPAIIG
jgi:hypothetical protein